MWMTSGEDLDLLVFWSVSYAETKSSSVDLINRVYYVWKARQVTFVEMTQ